MSVFRLWSTRQWLCSQECHGLCRLLAALAAQNARDAPSALIHILAMEVPLFLKPTCTPLVVLESGTLIKYVDADTLTVIQEQDLEINGAVDHTIALDAAPGAQNVVVSTSSNGMGEGSRRQGFELIAFNGDPLRELWSREWGTCVDSLAWSPDNDSLVVGIRGILHGSGAVLHLLDAETYDVIESLNLTGSYNWMIHYMKYTADGWHLVVICGGCNGWRNCN